MDAVIVWCPHPASPPCHLLLHVSDAGKARPLADQLETFQIEVGAEEPGIFMSFSDGEDGGVS